MNLWYFLPLKQWCTLSDNYKSLDWIISPIYVAHKWEGPCFASRCFTWEDSMSIQMFFGHTSRSIHAKTAYVERCRQPQQNTTSGSILLTASDGIVHVCVCCFNLASSYCFFWQVFFFVMHIIYNYCLANVFTYLHALCFPWLLSKQAWPEAV